MQISYIWNPSFTLPRYITNFLIRQGTPEPGNKENCPFPRRQGCDAHARTCRGVALTLCAVSISDHLRGLFDGDDGAQGRLQREQDGHLAQSGVLQLQKSGNEKFFQHAVMQNFVGACPFRFIKGSVADPWQFCTDPDLRFYFGAEPDPFYLDF